MLKTSNINFKAIHILYHLSSMKIVSIIVIINIKLKAGCYLLGEGKKLLNKSRLEKTQRLF